MAGAQNATLVPQAGLLAVPAADPTADPGFALLIDTQWSQLQGFVAGALKVPIDATTFKQRYGDFAKQADLVNCVDALKAVNALGLRFGDPARFEASILAGEFDAGHGKPAYVFGEIIWVANKIAGAAETYRAICDAIPQVFAAIKSPSDRRAVVKDMLTGKDGLHVLAQSMITVVDDLRTKTLAPFIADFGAAKTKVDDYASVSGAVYDQAKTDLGSATALVESTTQELARERKKYKDWSIAAGAGAGGLMVVTGGLAFPVALAWGLIAGLWPAEDARKAAEAQQKVLDEQTAIQKQRALLVADILSLNSYIPDVVTSLKAVDTALGNIGTVWKDQQAALQSIIDTTALQTQGNVAGLEDADKWIAQRRITEAGLAWKAIGVSTRAFSAAAFLKRRQM